MTIDNRYDVAVTTGGHVLVADGGDGGRILVLQEERTKTYETWEVAFRDFIVAGAKEEPYAEVCCPLLGLWRRYATRDTQSAPCP